MFSLLLLLTLNFVYFTKLVFNWKKILTRQNRENREKQFVKEKQILSHWIRKKKEKIIEIFLFAIFLEKLVTFDPSLNSAHDEVLMIVNTCIYNDLLFIEMK